MACETLQQKTNDKEKRIANYRNFRGRKVVENAFGILASRVSVLLDTVEKRPKVVRDIVLTCVVT